MLKNALRALALLTFLASPAGAVGTIAFSLSQQLDQFGTPLGGCLLYTIQAGTTSTPQNAFKDTGLTNPQPNPMSCDGFGRLPQFFLADGQIKIRLTDKFGNPVLTADNILVVGPSAGGGSGATIDPTTIAATGDLKHAYGTQVLSGWVRSNGRTIGSATSGATERANADTQALFQYLWSTDANLVVVGGRGASSIADWNANKQLTLPDGRGRGLAGLDDMGNAAAGRLTATYFGNSGSCSGALATVLGQACGGESLTLATVNLPPYTPAGGFSGTIKTLVPPVVNTAAIAGGPNTVGAAVNVNADYSGFSFVGTPQGGTSTPIKPIQPTILVTIYIKL